MKRLTKSMFIVVVLGLFLTATSALAWQVVLHDDYGHQFNLDYCCDMDGTTIYTGIRNAGSGDNPCVLFYFPERSEIILDTLADSANYVCSSLVGVWGGDFQWAISNGNYVHNVQLSMGPLTAEGESSSADLR